MPATRELSFAAHRSRPRADPGFEKPKAPLTFSLSLSLFPCELRTRHGLKVELSQDHKPNEAGERERWRPGTRSVPNT